MHRSDSSPFPLALSLALSILSFLPTGCGRDAPTAPGIDPMGATTRLQAAEAPGSNGSDFFPLDVGNRWHALAEQRITFEQAGQPPDQLLYEHEFRRELIGTEVLFGRAYTVQEESVTTVGPIGTRGYVQWVRYRQDRSGLYEADVALGTPPGDLALVAAPALQASWGHALPPTALATLSESRRAAYTAAWRELRERAERIRTLMREGGNARTAGRPQGALENEITRLRYPLHPGATWVIREQPIRFEATVEARETLDLLAGRFATYRIDITNETVDPADDDWVKAWFGRDGFLQFRYHLRVPTLDENGNEIGAIVEDYEEEVDALQLVTR